MPRIDLYMDDTSPPCHAVLMTAQHIGVEFNKKMVDIVAGDHMKPEFLKVSPTFFFFPS